MICYTVDVTTSGMGPLTRKEGCEMFLVSVFCSILATAVGGVLATYAVRGLDSLLSKHKNHQS